MTGNARKSASIDHPHLVPGGNPRDGAGSEKFWASSDRLHDVFKQNYPLEYGALDYNRYGADYRYHDDVTESFFKNLSPALRMSVTEELGN